MATIRYWAAAKAAAGRDSEEYDVASLADLVVAASEAHDERLAKVLQRCAWVVDDAPVGGRDHTGIRLGADSVVEALPPFAGG